MSEYVILVLVVVLNDGEVCKCHFFTGYPFSVCFDEGRVRPGGLKSFGQCGSDRCREVAGKVVGR